MSDVKNLEDWMDKYYPVEVSDLPDNISDIDAIKHSISKWKGLEPTVLEEYNLILNNSGNVLDRKTGYIFRVDGDSCALCKKHCDYSGEYVISECETCPLYKLLGEECCSGEDTPFSTLRNHKSPTKMINALEECLKIANSEL